MKYFSILIFYIQKTIVNTMIIFIRFIPKTQSKSWVIGVQEIAGLISNTHKAIPELISVNLFDHKFNYGAGYTYENMLPNDYKNYFKIRNYFRLIKFVFVTPIIFVHLLLTHSGFIYIGPRGFLISEVDNRAFEFKLLKRFNKKIVCILTGSDIRSIRLMISDSVIQQRENIANYLLLANPELNSENYEKRIIGRCEVINTYADIIYSRPSDQKSYLKNPLPMPIIIPESKFYYSKNKYSNLKKVRILHAPSNPIVKGTPLVRAAIAKLRKDELLFDYVEIIDETNENILDAMKESHIVIDQMYSFVPGMIGFEALAAKCVLITRSSPSLDESFPPDAENAWISCEPFELYEKLKSLVSNPKIIEKQAQIGQNWAISNISTTVAGAKFKLTLDSLL